MSMRGRERRIVGNEGKEISCLIQGHGSIHVFCRHHLLQEHVILAARRTVQASAKTCRNTTTTNKHRTTNEHRRAAQSF